ncbi:4Fe-4S dicluster domain-containing protein [Clostridium botulinum]|uniref:Coenzyme F420 hydrogenase/dehydrogenase, beta subunit C-terminal domain n=1 Tax=Clostridium botulinum TaxID=1491 RepID=UPI0013F0BCCD|nr:Coenzyme F420 hydrogenase/dehydrogenase, beta subunit C-terminal domain [Clostridium botulinum]MBY6917964.1 Coenzyme F420 hydrogenase/dehydrogenase, beta subunit C-terminal domain [Clostridium botulinum]NFL35837.1 4Fe-4S dicluster domain-containing protein [Clostridium botulinum]NFM05033.1 4Fe-4S dicluster domain-containing protein [Clostridium botulinum]NFO40976.1 4Fe-4S dicluster domain-containing protein [Clostridium botulinum]NFQ39718.1 4Fe-4S dicluster domain-containing protein [Clostr
MINISKKRDCSGCYGCANICPKQCISMKSDNEGFWYPKIDKDKCINCGLCEKVCPIINKSTDEKNDIISYACKNKDNKTRNTSSSGGIFSLLCNCVISKNGVVFGAAFNKEFEVNYMYAETVEQCEKFKGSKYVQSKIGNTYRQAKEFLDSGRIVLFSGTPCQISGLDSFLMKKYENLIMIDIACHGVPSPLVYKNYIESLENNNNSNISLFSFRDKSTGWKNYSLKVDFNNKKQVKEIGYNNIYIKGFLNDIYLRPSCYECKFKKPTTSADITLADYWGVQNIHPEFDDDKGTSLVLVNSKKGQDLFNEISHNMDFIKTDLDYAIRNNPCIVRPVKYNPKREKFFSEMNDNNIEKIIHKYTKVTFTQKVKRKTFGALRKIKKLIT